MKLSSSSWRKREWVASVVCISILHLPLIFIEGIHWVFSRATQPRPAQTDILLQWAAYTLKIKGGGAWTRSAKPGSSITDLSFGCETDMWALLSLAGEWAFSYVSFMLWWALWSMWRCASHPDWPELYALDHAYPFSCNFGLNSPTHNFKPVSMEFINILPYASI